MSTRTHYEVLMLHPSATHDVINAVHRVLAKKHHPDVAGPEDAKQMARINEAFGVLSDKKRRAEYDKVMGLTEDETQPAAAARSSFARQSMPGATNLKYEAGAWTVRPPTEAAPPPPTYGEAGPPPDHLRVSGSVISFGRYRGWAVSQVAATDRNYLEWLSRTMAGRTYRAELDAVLEQTRA